VCLRSKVCRKQGIGPGKIGLGRNNSFYGALGQGRTVRACMENSVLVTGIVNELGQRKQTRRDYIIVMPCRRAIEVDNLRTRRRKQSRGQAQGTAPTQHSSS